MTSAWVIRLQESSSLAVLLQDLSNLFPYISSLCPVTLFACLSWVSIIPQSSEQGTLFVEIDMYAGVLTPLFLYWEWGLGLLFYVLLSLNNLIWSHDFKYHLKFYGSLTASQIFLTSMLRYLRPLNHLHSISSSYLNLRMFKKVFKTGHLTPSYNMFILLVFPD